MEFRLLKKDLSTGVLNNRKVNLVFSFCIFLTSSSQGINGECSTCSHLPADQQCIQRIYVKKKKVDASYIGYGVSLAPKKNQIQPIPVSD